MELNNNMFNDSTAIKIRRVFNTPEENERIYEIIKDELSMVNPNHFENEDNFLNYVSIQVAVTYLFDFYDSEKEKSFKTMFNFFKKYIQNKYESYIKEFWFNNY